MRADRATVAGTVLVLVGAAVAAGPLVGVPLLDTEPVEPGTGTVDVTVEDTPDRATLMAADYDDGGYDLHGPPIPVTIEDLSGRPYLSYTILVPALDHQTTSLLIVEDAGRIRLTLRPSTLSDEAIRADSYDGTVTIHVIDDDGRRLVTETDVTIEVRE